MATLSSILSPSKGFHPTLRTTIYFDNPSNSEQCTLHLAYMLPPLVFVDPYELTLRSEFYTTRYRVFGGPHAESLELPIVALPPNAASVLILDANLTHASRLDGGAEQFELVVDVPLHLRYDNPASCSHLQRTTAAMNHHLTSFSWPKGSWKCPRSGTGTRIAQRASMQADWESANRCFPIELSSLLSPLLPYASPSSPSTSPHTSVDLNQSDFVLIPIPPLTSRGNDLNSNPHAHHLHALNVHVPIGNLADLRYVEGGLAACILLAFVSLLCASAATTRRLERQEDIKTD